MALCFRNEQVRMQTKLIEHFKAERWLYLFICFHLIVWTAVPALVRLNLPLDAIEGTIWSHQLEWGYDKNPFLNGWLTALAVQLGGSSGWMIYLFSQLSVITAFWVVWRLGKQMLAPVYALLAVFLLEGIQYYNFHAIDFNDNTLELGTWALTIYTFYIALKTKTKRAWLFTGCCAAVAMMAKYYTAALLAAMVLFLFARPENRQQLKTAAPYWGLLVFLALITPHIIWLFHHDFVTVTYVFERASSTPSWTNHFFFPAQFTWQQLQAFLPALILFGLLFMGRKPRVAAPPVTVNAFDKSFLLYVGLGPFLLTALLSIALGIKLRAGWGMPLQSLWGLLLFVFLPPRLSLTKVRVFMSGIIVLVGAMLVGYTYSLIDSPDPSTANFPGRTIAQTLTKQWNETYHTPLTYVAGSRWVGGNLGFYSSDHPAVFIEWDKRHAPWINETELRKHGAIFIWSITDDESMPADIKNRFPRLQPARILEFAWQRNTRNLPPIKIGMAILPPA